MKKVLSIICVICALFTFTACSYSINDNKPEEAVETLFERYRNKDDNVLTQLKETIENEVLNDDNKAKYQELMEKQYDQFAYVIKDVNENGDNATATVELTVLDYKSAIDKAEEELQTNPEKFNDDDGKFSDDKFMAYKIELMEKVEDTKTETIELNLTKTAGMWNVDELSSDDIKKLHGLY